MKIGELAQRSGVAPSKIRFLEARGLLAKVSRQSNGYREYAAETLEVLKIVTSAQQAGFSLEEIQRVLPNDLSHWQHDGLIAALEAKIAGIEAIQRRLEQTRKTLLELVHHIRTKPADIDCAENARRIIGKMSKAAQAAKK